VTDYPGQGTYNTGSTNTLTERSGAAIATDTIPAGSVILARNTGVGSHTLVLPVAATLDSLTVNNRVHTIAASGIAAFRVPASYGDANGRVGMYVGEGTQSEVKYYVLGT
jgi:peptidoglycan hydrolase-like protein with peptidoglycan-binding domain